MRVLIGEIAFITGCMALVVMAGCNVAKGQAGQPPGGSAQGVGAADGTNANQGPDLRSGLVIEQALDAGEKGSLKRVMGDQSGTQHYTWRIRYLRRMELVDVAAGKVASAKLRYQEEEHDYVFERLDGDEVLAMQPMSNQHREPDHVGIEYVLEDGRRGRSLQRADGQPIGDESGYLPGELSVGGSPIHGLLRFGLPNVLPPPRSRNGCSDNFAIA